MKKLLIKLKMDAPLIFTPVFEGKDNDGNRYCVDNENTILTINEKAKTVCYYDNTPITMDYDEIVVLNKEGCCKHDDGEKTTCTYVFH